MPNYQPSGRTEGLAPQVLANFGSHPEEDTVCRLTVFVFANNHGTGQAYWEFRLLLRRTIGGVAGAVVSTIVHHATGAAASWTAVCAVNEGDIEVTVTGALGATVDWLATSDDALCMIGAFPG